jgi:hypothetical protein
MLVAKVSVVEQIAWNGRNDPKFSSYAGYDMLVAKSKITFGVL